jgi:chitinase
VTTGIKQMTQLYRWLRYRPSCATYAYNLLIIICCILSVTSRPKKSKYGGAGRPKNVGFVISTYIPEYRDIDYAFVVGQTSDLLLFSAEPTSSGGLHFHFHDEKIKSARKHTVGKLFLTVGGGGRSNHFYSISKNRHLRESFISTLYETMKKYNLQGVDFDWEQPQNYDELEAYSQLIIETSKVFKPKQLFISVALHPWNDLLPGAKQKIDRVHLMSYDYGAKHSTLENAKRHVEEMLKRGFLRKQIVLGIPGYGRNIKNPGDVKTYGEIVDMMINEKANNNDNEKQDVYNGIYFNNIKTVRNKLRYAIKQGLGGVFLWEAGHDTKISERSLLYKMKQYTVKKKVFVDQTFNIHDNNGGTGGGRRSRRRRIAVDEL